jgi:hypothetical protein
MGENDKARALKEQSARSRDFRELSYVRGHWREDRPGPLSEPHEAAPDGLGSLHSQVPGHRWNGWRRLDLLSASEDQAGRLVAALEHAAARVAPEWAKTEASVRRAETLQHRAERARELRNGIVAAAAALAVIAEEIAGIHLGLGTSHQEAVDQIYGERLMQPPTAQPSSGKAHDK